MGRSKELETALAAAREAVDRSDYDQGAVHAERALALVEAESAGDQREYAAMLSELGNFYRGRLFEGDKAEPLLKRALEIQKNILDLDDPDLAATLHGLGDIYWRYTRSHSHLGWTPYDPFDGEALLRRALAIRQRTLGPDHPEVAASLESLAGLYALLDRREPAETHYRQALEVKERAYGETHPELSLTLRNFAEFYIEYNFKPAEAEALLRRDVAIQEELHGPQAFWLPDLLQSLAGLYRRDGRLDEALQAYERAVEIRRANEGDHAYGLDKLLLELGAVYQQAGRYQEARAQYLQALSISKALGVLEAGRTGEIRNRLARLEAEVGDSAGAEEQLRETLADYDREGRREDVVLNRARRDLLELYRDEGRDEEAVGLCEQVVAQREEQFGANDSEVGDSLCRLAEAYLKAGRPADAEQTYLRALLIWIDVWGYTHDKVAEGIEGLLSVYRDRGEDDPLAVAAVLRAQGQACAEKEDPNERPERSRLLLKAALAIEERALGPEDADLLPSLESLAALSIERGAVRLAEMELERVLAIKEAAFGPEDESLVGTLEQLSAVYERLGRGPEAASALERARTISSEAR